MGLLKPVAFPGRLERRQKIAGWAQSLSLTEGAEGGKESFSDTWTWPNTGLYVNNKRVRKTGRPQKPPPTTTTNRQLGAGEGKGGRVIEKGIR